MRGVIYSKILPSAAIVVLAIFLPLSSCDLIEDTCKQTPNYQLCVSILRSDPKGPGADVTGLGLIMVNSLKSKSTSALETIDKLLKSKPELKIPLTQCNENYNFILKYDIPEAVEALTKGDPKFAEDAMRDSARVAQECENGFKPPPSPMTDVNEVAHDISLVAVAIIRLLL